MSFDPDPNKVIPPAVEFAVNALEAAYKEPSVKRFVFTSSSAAAVISSPDIPAANITEDTWSDFIVDAAWADPPYTPERGFVTYAASKNQAEKAVWKFHKENRHKRPDLTVNTSKIFVLVEVPSWFTFTNWSSQSFLTSLSANRLIARNRDILAALASHIAYSRGRLMTSTKVFILVSNIIPLLVRVYRIWLTQWIRILYRRR
jgi:nucleoside-diphosphate-sugar epimerase